MRKTQEDKDNEYLDKMRDYILENIKEGRNIYAILGSINRSGKWWVYKLEMMEDVYNTIHKKT